jgi:hypothetical protein
MHGKVSSSGSVFAYRYSLRLLVSLQRKCGRARTAARALPAWLAWSRMPAAEEADGNVSMRMSENIYLSLELLKSNRAQSLI